MFPMKPSEFKISNSVESFDEKTAENHRYCYVVEKRLVSKLSKSHILIAQIEDLSEYFVKIRGPYLLYYTFQEISHQRALRSGRARPNRAGS